MRPCARSAGNINKTPAFSMLWQCSNRMGVCVNSPRLAAIRSSIRVAPIPIIFEASKSIIFLSPGLLPLLCWLVCTKVFFLRYHPSDGSGYSFRLLPMFWLSLTATSPNPIIVGQLKVIPLSFYNIRHGGLSD